MKILVIIVAYNLERWIDRCLGSLRESTVRPDVLVVDNGSKDGTVKHIESGYPEVRLVRSKENLGFGKANNIGIKIACEEGYDAVYLMNQDAWIRPDTLGTLCQISKEHPEYGMLSPVHLDGTETALDKGFAAYSGKKSKADIDMLALDGCDLVELPFVNAAHWFIPVAVLRRIGGFSPLFHMYGEDLDMTNRLHHYGYKIGYTPLVFAIHDRGGEKRNKLLHSELHIPALGIHQHQSHLCNGVCLQCIGKREVAVSVFGENAVAQRKDVCTYIPATVGTDASRRKGTEKSLHRRIALHNVAKEWRPAV